MTNSEKDSYIIALKNQRLLSAPKLDRLWSTLFFKDTALTASKT